RIKQDETLIFDKRFCKSVEQCLLIGEALNPTRPCQPFRVVWFTVAMGIQFQVLCYLKTTFLQHPAIRNGDCSPGWHMHRTRQDVRMVLAPPGIGHDTLK